MSSPSSSSDGPRPRIDTLLQLAPEHPDRVIQYLQRHADLAAAADSNGSTFIVPPSCPSFLHAVNPAQTRSTQTRPNPLATSYTLLHAAASYNHTTLLRTLVQTYSASPDIRDTDGDTPLFYAETLIAARYLVEECGADWSISNEEGRTAEDNALANVEDGETGNWAEVADFLERCRKGGGSSASTDMNGTSDGMVSNAIDVNTGNASFRIPADPTLEGVTNPAQTDVRPPPPLPPNVRINLGTMSEEEQRALEAEPDPEFRRRIEELAAREDFQSAEGQEELRRLVLDAVGGMREDEGDIGDGRNVRRRI